MIQLNQTEIAFLLSLNDSELLRVLELQPKDEQLSILNQLDLASAGKLDAKGRDAERQREKRSEAARIVIPECKNPQRRERALRDPELFLKTYDYRKVYRLAFGPHRERMIREIYEKAKYGGRQAIAAPRGCGKSEITKGMLVFIIFALLCRFPLITGATNNFALRIYKAFQKNIRFNPLLYEDFPEVCHPVRALEGAPQRAAKQHIEGVSTQLVWSSDDYLSFAHVPESPYGGCKLAYAGLDSAFRGYNIDGDRIDFVLIDDPETPESARQDGQIETRRDLIDKDIAGLVGEEEILSLVLVTTVQTRKSISYEFTSREKRPAFNGLIYGLIVKWPINSDLWSEYIALRMKAQKDPVNPDPYGMLAVEFYLANREAMHEGSEMLTEDFVSVTTPEGVETVFSKLQECYNKIADTNLAAFCTEYQNDPPEDEVIDTVGLTAGLVAQRISGYEQGRAPDVDDYHIFLGCDIGKYASHWVKVACWGNAIGTVVDYGVIETYGLGVKSNSEAIDRALLQGLTEWREDITKSLPPLLSLVDSGDYTSAIYEFCRQSGDPFYASKGWDAGRFRMGTESDTRKLFEQAYAQYQDSERLWLYHINTEHWKHWVQQRFVTETFDENGNFRDGTLSLFSTGLDRKKHLSFAHHMVSEEQREYFEEGKGIIKKWVELSRNNHWLDAISLACAAASCAGIRLISQVQSESTSPSPPPRQQPAFTDKYGQPYLVTQR